MSNRASGFAGRGRGRARGRIFNVRIEKLEKRRESKYSLLLTNVLNFR